MSHILVRNETIPEPRARGLAYDVVEDNDLLRSVGVVADGGGRWRIHSAGPGVPADTNAWYPTLAETVQALLDARTEAGKPGGALHVDDTGLTGFQRAVLDFAQLRFSRRGMRDAEIRHRFDISPTEYTHHLLALLDVPAALAYAPGLVNRERRIRAARAARRSAHGRVL